MAQELLSSDAAYNKMARAANPNGDGEASARIAEAIKFEFGLRETRPEDFQ